MTTLYEHIGHKIRELRTTYPKGTLSQEALAEKLKVAPNTVSRWETGKYKPTPKDLDSVARFVAASITTFFRALETGDSRVTALTYVSGGLETIEYEEVI